MNKHIILVVVLALIQLSTQQTPQQTPVIGIYTQDAEELSSTGNVDPFSTYIAASYVKNL